MAHDAVTRARTNLVLTNEFFGHLALRLQLIPDTAIPTACTDGISLRYNPKWLCKLPAKQIEGVLAHEVLHCAFLHMTRRGARDDMRWNAACDFNINDFLMNNHFQLPADKLWDAKEYPYTMSVDMIYNKLPKSFMRPTWGFVVQRPNGSKNGEEGHAQIEADWKQAVTLAAHIARMRGKLPAGIDALIEGLLQPQISWLEILRRFVSEPAKDDYTWSRPNRRYMGLNLYMPALYSETVGEIIYAIDTSGSMPDEHLQTAASEANGLHHEVRPNKTVVMSCDAAVHTVDEFGPDDTVKFRLKGRGGTNFIPIFEEIEVRRYRPKCLVVFTDGYGAYPDNPPEYPVLWVMTTDYVPPFGESLRVSV